MIDYESLLRALAEQQVAFMVVGGVAAVLHGSARLTEDLDIVYERTPENMERLVCALEPKAPYLRGAPAGLPFRWDVRTLQQGLNFTLETTAGPIDLLGELTGGGTYERLLPGCVRVALFGLQVQCIGLTDLIHFKRAAGRPKDLESLAELEALSEAMRDYL